MANTNFALTRFAIGFGVAVFFLALAQSLSSCLMLSAPEAIVVVFLSIVLFTLTYNFDRFNLNTKGWSTKLALSAVLLALATYFLQPVSCAVALFPAFALGVFFAIVAVGYTLYRRVIDIVNDESLGFALCTGMPPNKDSQIAKEYEGYKALTPWLHEKIQKAAGIEKPLTFGDLWRVDGFPPSWMPDLKEADPERKKSINLQLVTTNLTHSRPYILPFDQEHDRIFFKLEELKPFFPEEILTCLEQKSTPYVPANGYPGCDASVRQLPPAKDLPILFAARLSLSFPGLLSAIPLYMINEEPEKEGKRKLVLGRRYILQFSHPFF